MAERFVTASAFRRNFAKYQDESIEVGLIKVTSHQRVVGGFLSTAELARYERFKAQERHVIKVEDLDDELAAALDDAIAEVKRR